jgi:hypothetical protein
MLGLAMTSARKTVNAPIAAYNGSRQLNQSSSAFFPTIHAVYLFRKESNRYCLSSAKLNHSEFEPL